MSIADHVRHNIKKKKILLHLKMSSLTLAYDIKKCFFLRIGLSETDIKI